jgi:hypothetical protein
MENVLASIPEPRTSRLVWIGRALTGLVVAFLVLDAAGKLIAVAPVLEGTQRLGYSVHLVRPIGLVLLASALLHLVPRTQVLGALLVTAYLGGATATHVRVGEPFWFPVAMGAIFWAAFTLRSTRARALVFGSVAS